MQQDRSPFERLFSTMTKPWFVVAYFGLVMISYFYLDQYLALYFYQHDIAKVIPSLTWLTHLGSNILNLGLFLCLALLFRYGYKQKKWEVRCWFLFACIFLTTCLCTVLKVSLGRARPELLFSVQQFGFFGWHTEHAYWSFPSGHTTTLASLIFGLIILFPRYTTIILTVGLIFIATRVMLFQHYISDVLVSFYLVLLEIQMLIWFLRQRVHWLPVTERNTIV